ncbi:Late transcription factor [Eptesipox virus]|uniref:Late transcription factor n=1 Tax=Eptesipox virus TaxID=1329402 RepID=A0A220T6E1_9POXV|nr:Late transcription factor [Eptesipox virus]ASK51281.1 Late transcription factor [Eptesipox virus]WAH71039.1 late transcription factor [Eptesipox virus]
MSWTMQIGESGTYKSLEEIRAHIKATATESIDDEVQHDDLFPEDVEIPPNKPKTTKKPPIPKKRATTNSGTKPKTTRKKVKTESDEEKSDDDVKSYSSSSSKVDSSTKMIKSYSPKIDLETEVEESDMYAGTTVENDQTDDKMECDDLKTATDNVIKFLKDINTRVNAISTVLTDVQAASCSRQYTTLIKSIDNLKIIAESGKVTVSRKKTRQTTKK